MKSILDNRPELAKEVNKVAEVAGYLWQKGWAERNGGNITVNITEYVDDEIRQMPAISEVKQIGVTLPHLKGCYFYCKKDVATNLLWSMIPETKAFCPRGLGMIPYQLPSSVELADATIKELADYDVVMWEKHGIFAVDRDVMAAFDQIDVLNKSALIYIAAKNMGFEPDGMSQEQMKEMSVAFNLPK